MSGLGPEHGAEAAGGEAGPFRLGLAMAGAISAGAYTAGVFDFLIRALEEWDRARAAGVPDVPAHEVVLQVIAGASAGAIVGGIGVVALAEGIQLPSGAVPEGQPLPPVLPRLYRAWVEDPVMVGADGVGFLSLSDLTGADAPGEVRSLLNGGVVDALLGRALAHLVPAAAPKSYLARDLDLYFTVSNLRGVPYEVRFANGTYGMSTHADRFHYRVAGLGTTPVDTPFGAADGMAIQVARLAGPDPAWKAFGQAAVASGAFPVGLAAQALELPTTDYGSRRFPLADQRAERVGGLVFPANYLNTPQPYRFVAVDGGMINNEPFEYARCALLKPGFDRNPSHGVTAYGAVVMVDPFPDRASLPPEGKPGQGVASILRALVPTLIAQSRFKVDQLLLAAADDIYSRFIIQPSRTHVSPVLKRDVEDPYGLACGLLGGFGGFLDCRFREHDFQLGRRNCQKFLMDRFTLPAGNTAVAGWPPAPAAGGEPPEYPIIPRFGSARTPVELPPWPRMRMRDFEAFEAAAARRARAVLKALIRDHVPTRFGRTFVRGARLWLQSDIDEALALTVLADLVRRDQIEGWDLTPIAAATGLAEATVRQVVAALLDPSYAARSATGIFQELADAGVPMTSPAAVGALLARLARSSGVPYAVEKVQGRQEPYYRLLRRRDWWQRIPGIGVLERLAWPPRKDFVDRPA